MGVVSSASRERVSREKEEERKRKKERGHFARGRFERLFQERERPPHTVARSVREAAPESKIHLR